MSEPLGTPNPQRQEELLNQILRRQLKQQNTKDKNKGQKSPKSNSTSKSQN